MGFTAGLYVYPKYNEDISYNDICVIHSLISYDDNAWAKEKFSCAEEYAKAICTKYVEQKKEVVDFYRPLYQPDEFGYKRLGKEYSSWCSNGAGDIYSYISSLCIRDKDHDINILSKSDIAKIMLFCLDKINEYKPKPATIKYAFRYQRDEEDEIKEDPEITLIPCDGFEVEFDGTGTIIRIDTNPGFDCDVYFPDKYYDYWEQSGYEEGLRGCAKLLAEVDFENSLVIYSGGW